MMTHTKHILTSSNSCILQFRKILLSKSSRNYSTQSQEIGSVGTTDCILIGNSCLTVIDFKYGKGLSGSAEKNPQMMI